MKNCIRLLWLSATVICLITLAWETGATPRTLRAFRSDADVTVSGRVVDETKSGLPGVSVVVKGTNQGTTTDGTGSFTIKVPTASSTLTFSFVGYASREIVVGSQTNLTVALSPDDQSLNEVVVVGYGTQLKKDVTGPEEGSAWL